HAPQRQGPREALVSRSALNGDDLMNASNRDSPTQTRLDLGRATPAGPPAAALVHPAVGAWFAKTFAGPTNAQSQAWPAIKAGRHVLVAAPTGSGKTLAAFLAAIDD